MPTVKTALELRLYAALRRIMDYRSVESLNRYAERDYGVRGSEAVEMAYENVLQEAKNGLRGVRLQKPKPTPAQEAEG